MEISVIKKCRLGVKLKENQVFKMWKKGIPLVRKMCTNEVSGVHTSVYAGILAVVCIFFFLYFPSVWLLFIYIKELV